MDEAVAGWPWDSRVDAAAARPGGPATSAKAAVRVIAIPRIKIRRHADHRSTFVGLMGYSCHGC